MSKEASHNRQRITKNEARTLKIDDADVEEGAQECRRSLFWTANGGTLKSSEFPSIVLSRVSILLCDKF